MTEPLVEWLGRLGLERYAEVFAAHDIDVDVLPSLTEQDLVELGVSMGHRKKILAAARVAHHASAEVTGTDHARSTAAGGERRQLTVMFCDIVGSTALAERLDPEDFREIVRAYQESAAAVIDRFEGHIAQYLGDGLLVYFGHPVAHEDDAERAVRAAIEIVDQLADRITRPPFTADMPIAVRIGIHTGLVVIGEVGGGARHERLALGDTPNIAARLQGLAQPGRTVISEQTRRLVGGKFLLDDLGPQPIRGIRDPVRAWTVRGVRESSSRFAAAARAGLSGFVGRKDETDLIVSRWERAAAGHGQVVILSGEAGIGKSRILAEVRSRLSRARTTTLGVQCSPYHIHSPYHPIAHAMAGMLGFRRLQSPQARLARLEKLAVRLLDRPALDVELLASILSLDAAPRDAAGGLPAFRQKKESIRALVDLLAAAAARAPVLVLFEDAHWSDPTSLEVLDAVIARASTIPVLLVVTHRPDFQSPWIPSADLTMRSLGRLGYAESAALIARVAEGKTLPPGLLDQIIAKADGVPLFVEELTRFLLDSDRLPPSGATQEYPVNQSVTIPATLRDSLMARLDRVAPAKAIAQIGSVIGREFSYEMIRAVANLPAEDLDGALAALTASGLAVRLRDAPDAAWSFKHALVQDVAYASLLKGRRQELHRAIARTLEERHPELRDTEPELFARHTAAGGQPEAAIPYWQQAASLSLSKMALSEAASQLNRGLELVASLPPSVTRDRIELPLHALLGTTHMLAKGWGASEVEHAYARANELSKSVENVEETIWPLWGVWVFHHVRGETSRARDIAEEISRVAMASGSRTAQLVAHMILAQSCSYSALFDRSREHLAHGRRLYHPVDDKVLMTLYSTDLSLAIEVHEAHLLWVQGCPDQAVELYQRTLAYAESLGHPYSLSWALTWGSILYLLTGDVPSLLANVARGVQIADHYGFAYVAAIGEMARGWGEAQLGDPAPAITRMQSGLDAFRSTGAGIAVPFFKSLIAELLGRAGRKPEGLALLQQAAAQVEQWGERWQEPEIDRVRGVLLAAGPDPDIAAARSSLARALHVADAHHAPAWRLRAAMALARLGGEPAEARAARATLAEVLAGFHEGFETADLRDARELLATPRP